MVFSQISRIGQKNWELKNKNRNCQISSQLRVFFFIFSDSFFYYSAFFIAFFLFSVESNGYHYYTDEYFPPQESIS